MMHGMIISIGNNKIKRFSKKSIDLLKRLNEIHLKGLESLNLSNITGQATGHGVLPLNIGWYTRYWMSRS